MIKPVIKVNRKNENLKIKISALPAWEDFDRLIAFLLKHYDAKTTQEADGPDARRWILECRDQTIELIHDDMSGNYLLAPVVESEEIINEIANDLEERLSLKRT